MGSESREVKNIGSKSGYSLASPLGCVDGPGGSLMYYGFQQGENMETSEIHGLMTGKGQEFSRRRGLGPTGGSFQTGIWCWLWVLLVEHKAMGRICQRL